MVSTDHRAQGSQREPPKRHPCNGATKLDALRAGVRACGRPARREARVSDQSVAPWPNLRGQRATPKSPAHFRAGFAEIRPDPVTALLDAADSLLL